MKKCAENFLNRIVHRKRTFKMKLQLLSKEISLNQQKKIKKLITIIFQSSIGLLSSNARKS